MRNMYDVTETSFTVNPEMRMDTARAMATTFANVGHEFFVNDCGEIDESMVMPREDVAELILDANLLEQYTPEIAVAAYAVWAKRHNEDEWNLILDNAFYGKMCGM